MREKHSHCKTPRVQTTNRMVKRMTNTQKHETHRRQTATRNKTMIITKETNMHVTQEKIKEQHTTRS